MISFPYLGEGEGKALDVIIKNEPFYDMANSNEEFSIWIR